MSILDSEDVFIDEKRVNKYKENDREVKREQRYQQLQRDAESRYRKKLNDWLARERAKERNIMKEKERAEQRAKDKKRLIERDMEYDEVLERKKRKRDIKAHQRYQDERKRIRDREQEEDFADARLE